MLHILESGWWVPEDTSEAVAGRVIHIGSFTKPNTSKLPGALQQGTKNGRIVVLQGRGGTAKIWMVEHQVHGVDLLEQGAYVRIVCMVPDMGYSENRIYMVQSARRAEMTRLPKTSSTEEEQPPDPAEERYALELSHLVLTAKRHSILAQLLVERAVKTIDRDEAIQAIREQLEVERANQPPSPPAPSSLSDSIDYRMVQDRRQQQKQNTAVVLIRVDNLLRKAATELFNDHPVRLKIEEALTLLRTVEP